MCEFKLYGRAEIYINGKLVDKVDNLIVNVGKQEIAKLLGAGLGGVSFSHIAIGTGTTAPASTDTALGAEVMRAAATVTLETTNITNDTVVFTADFSFTSAYAITEAGVFNAATGGVLLDRITFATKNVDNRDTLRIVMKITVQ